MAPSVIKEDLYVVLEVKQDASSREIRAAYTRLARQLHPDRNAKHNATGAFQLLSLAYETLSDANKRWAYDASRTSSRPQAAQPTAASTSQTDTLSDEAQIGALQKSKEARADRWRVKKNAYEASIFDLKRSARKLEQDMKNLASIAAAEAAAEAAKNSWGTWLLSPLYKKVEESEGEKARKDVQRQERMVEKDLKERRLTSIEADAKAKENEMKIFKLQVDAANGRDDYMIRVAQAKIQARECREREQREKAERERMEKIHREWRKQQEAKEKEAAERYRQQESERQAAAQARYDADRRKMERLAAEQAEQLRRHAIRHGFYDPVYRTACDHKGWWEKVQGRAHCPSCRESWPYLLECPHCPKQACPKCQYDIRHGIPPGTGKKRKEALPGRARPPSPIYSCDWYD